MIISPPRATSAVRQNPA